jgi:hypothetical protein
MGRPRPRRGRDELYVEAYSHFVGWHWVGEQEQVEIGGIR